MKKLLESTIIVLHDMQSGFQTYVSVILIIDEVFKNDNNGTIYSPKWLFWSKQIICKHISFIFCPRLE